MRNSVYSGHLTRTMLPSFAVDVDRQVLGIIDELQEVFGLLARCRARGHEGDMEIEHPAVTNPRGFFSHWVIPEVDNRFDPQPFELREARKIRLGAAIVDRADLPEIVDPDTELIVGTSPEGLCEDCDHEDRGKHLKILGSGERSRAR